MSDEPLVGAEQEAKNDFAVLFLLLCREDHDGLWSIDELMSARQDRIRTEDSISRLLRAGLIHRHDEFVFPTHAATRYSQIAGYA